MQHIIRQFGVGIASGNAFDEDCRQHNVFRTFDTLRKYRIRVQGLLGFEQARLQGFDIPTHARINTGLQVEFENLFNGWAITLELQHRPEGVDIRGHIVKTGGGKKVDQIANVIHPGLPLRIHEKHRLANDLDTTFGEFIDQGGV